MRLLMLVAFLGAQTTLVGQAVPPAWPVSPELAGGVPSGSACPTTDEKPQDQASQAVQPAKPSDKQLEQAAKDHLRKQVEAAQQALKQAARAAIVRSQGRTCAIPLLNVLRGNTRDHITVVPAPSGSAQLPMPEVKVPAPSCDDVK